MDRIAVISGLADAGRSTARACLPVRRACSTLAIALLLGFGISSAANAQGVNEIPPAIINPQVEEPPREDDAFGFFFELEIPDSRRGLEDEQLETVRFVINDMILEGQTVFSEAELRSTFETLLGTEISLGDLFRVAQEIELKYRELGYFLTRAFVPEQRVGDGVFRMQILEGFVGEVVIQGEETGPVTELVRNYAENVKKDVPLRNETLERYLLLANDIPGVTAAGVLRPLAGGEPGAAQLVVTVTRKVLDGFTRLDNRGSKFNGPWAATGGFGTNSLTEAGERMSFVGLVTRDWDEQRFASGRYEQKIGGEGTTLRAALNYTTSEPGFTLNQEDTKVQSKSSSLELEISHPYIRTRNESLEISAAFTVRNVRTQLDTGAGSSIFNRENIRSLSVGGTYTLADEWDGISVIEARVHQGLPIIGASRKERLTDIDTTRFNSVNAESGVSDFTKFTLDVKRLQRLGTGFNLLMAGQAQWTWDRLLSTEEFAVGGSQFGRGYDASEINGDLGLALLFELQYGEQITSNHEILGFLDGLLREYVVYGFYDFGHIWNIDDEQGLDETSSASLASAGIGTRLRLVDGISGGVEIAKPLTRGVATQNEFTDGVTSKQRRPLKFLFNVTSQF